MLATYLAISGKNVDIVTTSSILAQRDSDYFKEFYKFFNLTCSHNISEKNTGDPKLCYC